MKESTGCEAEIYAWTLDNLQIQALQALTTCRSNVTLFSRNKENPRKLVRKPLSRIEEKDPFS
jgi:hypothetical protein